MLPSLKKLYFVYNDPFPAHAGYIMPDGSFDVFMKNDVKRLKKKYIFYDEYKFYLIKKPNKIQIYYLEKKRKRRHVNLFRL